MTIEEGFLGDEEAVELARAVLAFAFGPGSPAELPATQEGFGDVAEPLSTPETAAVYAVAAILQRSYDA